MNWGKTKLLAVCFWCISAVTFAWSAQRGDRFLQRMQGNWYDLNRTVVLQVDGDSINQCPVEDIILGAQGHVIFRIKEDTGLRDIHIFEGDAGYHNHKILNYKTWIRNTVEPVYTESVGGICIGMSSKDLVERYGEPDYKERLDNSYWGMEREFWLYSSIGFSVKIEGDMVHSITIYKGKNRYFDQSGLNCENPISDFEMKYGHKMDILNFGHNKKGYQIRIDGPASEVLNFDDYPKSITLSGR